MAKVEYILDPEGLFNPMLKFAFTNITEEVFESKWNGSPITIPPGATVELPHHLAVKFTKELVDKIMIGNAKLDEIAKNQPYYRSPQGSSLGVPAARKVWEDQICRQMAVDEESPQTQVLRATIKAELLADMAKEPAKQGSQEALSGAPTSVSEFADLINRNEKGDKPQIKLKQVDPSTLTSTVDVVPKNKGGRPRKIAEVK